MNRQSLPEKEQIVRYTKPSLIGDDGMAVGSNFLLRSDETGLSINWLGAFNLEKHLQLNEVRRLCRLNLRPNGRFAELNVGAIKANLAGELNALNVIRDPLEETEIFEADPSHALIIGLPPGDSAFAEFVGDLIADCVTELHFAVE